MGPRYVAEELAATHLTEQRHRADAHLWAARAETIEDPATAERLRADAATAQAEADALAERATGRAPCRRRGCGRSSSSGRCRVRWAPRAGAHVAQRPSDTPNGGNSSTSTAVSGAWTLRTTGAPGASLTATAANSDLRSAGARCPIMCRPATAAIRSGSGTSEAPAGNTVTRSPSGCSASRASSTARRGRDGVQQHVGAQTGARPELEEGPGTGVDAAERGGEASAQLAPHRAAQQVQVLRGRGVLGVVSRGRLRDRAPRGHGVGAAWRRRGRGRGPSGPPARHDFRALWTEVEVATGERL